MTDKHKKDKDFYEKSKVIFGSKVSTRIQYNENNKQLTSGKINTPVGVKIGNKQLDQLSYLAEDYMLPSISIGRSGNGLLIELTR